MLFGRVLRGCYEEWMNGMKISGPRIWHLGCAQGRLASLSFSFKNGTLGQS